MHLNPLVTIIIPSYNHSKWIGDAIASVQDQTYDNWELIVVDDGSQDDTAKILQTYAEDPRIQVICNPVNRGQSAVVNQALYLSRGEFICFLPSDDWYLPQKIQLQVERFQDRPEDYGVVYGKGQRYFGDIAKLVDIDLPTHEGWVLRQLIEGNFVYPVTPMFRRACFQDFPFDETYSAEGEAIYLKIAIKYRFSFVNHVVGVMRDHPGNTGKKTRMMYADNLRYWNEFFSRRDIPASIRPLKRWCIAKLERMTGLTLINIESRHAAGRKHLFKAIYNNPKLLFDWKVIAGISLSCMPKSIAQSINVWRDNKKALST